MTKNELVAQLAEITGFSKKDAEVALNGVTTAITDALKKGDEVRLVGFGTFKVSERAARTGRNPQTGQTIQIKASKSPAFKAGKELRDAVN
jgi:Bacterial nucleoid DNA-binding protein